MIWRRSLVLARDAINLSNPNPRVGCVITSQDGSVLGEGFTQQAGGPHAEIMALRNVATNGSSVEGSTAWVTLEPCSHQGRTPPCCEALIVAGVKHVMVAATDPNPHVAGSGIARLRNAGIDVRLLHHDNSASIASRELNIGFFSRMIRRTPWVRLKIAASIDGTTALSNGESQWITGEPSRNDGHAWRARACAVLTGIGTVLQDNPRLDARLPDVSRQPHLVVVDSDLNTPLSARLFDPCAKGLHRQIWIYHAVLDCKKQAALQARGAQLIHAPGLNGKVDLKAMLRDLAQREVNEVHVEAGHKLNGSLMREGLVDELLLYQAPLLLGEGASISSFGPLQRLQDGIGLHFISVDLVGGDLRVLARLAGRDRFLSELSV